MIDALNISPDPREFTEMGDKNFLVQPFHSPSVSSVSATYSSGIESPKSPLLIHRKEDAPAPPVRWREKPLRSSVVELNIIDLDLLLLCSWPSKGKEIADAPRSSR